MLGRRTQAIVFFLALTLPYLLGMFLADFGNVSPVRHEYYFLAHILNGGETIIASLLTSGVIEDHLPRHFGAATGEIGTLYTAVAALLNVYVIMDAYGIKVGIRPEEDEEKKTPEEAEASA